MVEVSRYFESHGFVRALTGVSLEVRRGEVFGLLGSSSSGKTTVLKILAGQLAPSEGKARVFGRSPRRRATRARIGYLPQTSNSMPSAFLREICGLFNDLFGRQKSPLRRPAANSEIVAAERHAWIKLILIKHPELVLLDEPFADLDAAGCRQMKAIILKLAQAGSTVILSGSSLVDTKDVCQRLAVLRRGQIEAIGTIPELLATRDSLRYIGELLPARTAERVLQTIRQDVSGFGPADETPVGPLPAASRGKSHERVTATVHDQEPVLARLSKPNPPSPDPAKNLSPTVNQDLLEALVKAPKPDSR